jgi:hypothetical protein
MDEGTQEAVSQVESVNSLFSIHCANEEGVPQPAPCREAEAGHGEGISTGAGGGMHNVL